MLTLPALTLWEAAVRDLEPPGAVLLRCIRAPQAADDLRDGKGSQLARAIMPTALAEQTYGLPG